jgi:hypothetical protein
MRISVESAMKGVSAIFEFAFLIMSTAVDSEYFIAQRSFDDVPE